MNNGEQSPPSNKEILSRIKFGELGPVELRCADDATEAEKLRVARANAENELAMTRAMVAQGVPLRAVCLNLTTAAQEMERVGCDHDTEIRERHVMMDQARCLRIAVNFMMSKEPKPEQPHKN